MTQAHTPDHDCDHREHAEADPCCADDSLAAAVTPMLRGGRAYKVRGLDCAEEVSALKRAVGPAVGGVDRLGFDVLNGRMTVASIAREVPEEAILEAVATTGMRAVPWETHAAQGRGDSHRREQLFFTAVSGASLLLGIVLHFALTRNLAEALRLFVSHAAPPMPWPEMAAYLAAMALGGRFVVVKAWYAARALRPDINLLMVIAVLGALAIGEWFEAATVAFLFALSLTLEGWSVGRARRAISALLDLAPPTVRLRRAGADGSERVVPVGQAQPGDHFIVHGGERIALDGRVVAGASAVNQAPITGESLPLEKGPGAEVYAGTINGDGMLTIEATKAAEDSTLARIIRMVEEAHSRRAPSEQWVERFARFYTPAVMALALLVFLVPPLALGGAWVDWFYRALVLLVIACPCALVISTPVSIVAALAAAARAGVLIKGGAFLERPAHLKAIALDKTGTITRGEPEVTEVIPLDGHTETELLTRAAALEARSSHPLARAILRYAELKGIPAEVAGEVQVLKGKGLTGTVGGEPFWLGSHRYAAERGQGTAQIARQAEVLERGGTTVIVVGNTRHVCGLLAVRDTLRPQAHDVVAQLHAAGIRHVIMLTGDNRVTAEVIAREVGIDEVHAELLPEDKLRKVERLMAEYGAVAMVGDGVNDAPALARASVGIAMGAVGSDAAIETADIALMADDVSKLPWLIGHSRRTLAIIRQNIAFALGVKAVFFALTFAGMASLWGAIAADVGASLLVVFNALRLLRPTTLSNHTAGR